MNRLICKILALIGTFILPLLATVAPFKLQACIARRGEQGKRVLSYLMCLGGGIFFGTYLLHMGPEVREMIHKALPMDYPIADLLTGVGFFFVLFAEKIVLKCNEERNKDRKSSIRQTELVGEVKNTVSCRTPGDNCEPCMKGLPCVGDDGKVLHEVGPDGVLRLIEKKDITPTSESIKTVEDLYLIQTEKPPRRTRTISHRSTVSSGPHGHHHNTRSLVLILALSLHRIFEGMSVGLQGTNQAVIQLFFAVMCHEIVIGFSLGLQFVKSNFPLRRLLITSLVCSFIMPLGVAIGTIMTETGHQSNELDLTNGVLQAFAMGTFIYVTFFEILHEEIDAEDTSVAKVVFIAVGFAMMAVLTLIPEEDVPVINPLTNHTLLV